MDQIFYAAALAANQARVPLAKMAVEETRMGVVEDKVTKVRQGAERGGAGWRGAGASIQGRRSPWRVARSASRWLICSEKEGVHVCDWGLLEVKLPVLSGPALR